ncbi:hypothetical protein CDD83_9160 [Cordyceps sp. RAO-2017]|nr:hypothetical protein CDD83_9160 [Cordyceps sp. RAO-2017]
MLLAVLATLPQALALCRSMGRYRSDGIFFPAEPELEVLAEEQERRGEYRFSKYVKEECRWEGEAPGCGTTDRQLGDVDNGWVFVAHTKYSQYSDICINNMHDLYHGQECCESYGAFCWSGFKRLWCKKTHVRRRKDRQDVAQPGDPGPTDIKNYYDSGQNKRKSEGEATRLPAARKKKTHQPY